MDNKGSESSKTMRLLLVDDHPVFRDGLRALFGLIEGMEVVSETGSGEEGVRLALSDHPDVVLMDVNMPGIGGIEATRIIVSNEPRIKVVMLTMVEDDEAIFASMKAGARGYVLKTAEDREILDAVRSAAAGQVIYSPAIADRLMAYFADTKPIAKPSGFAGLSHNEREILRRLARGLDIRTISSQLMLSPQAVHELLAEILAKLQVADQAQAIQRARRDGLV